MMKMKNRISAVEQPKNPQKILRAKASRNVSRTSASVTAMALLFMNRLHENIFEGAARARHRFDRAMFGAQEVDGKVCLIAAREKKLDIAVALGNRHGLGAQVLFQPLGHVLGLLAVAAAGRQVFDLALERAPSAINYGHAAAEQFDLG